MTLRPWSSVYSPHPPVASATRRRVGQGTQISYTGILLAVLLGVLHAALAPVITVAGVHPNVVLVATVLATDLRGFGVGVIFAFIAGLTANLLVREPLGSIPLGLLLVAAVLVGSILVDLLSLGILRLVDVPLAGGLPTEPFVSAALLNAGVAALLVVPLRLVALRNTGDEKAAW